MKLADLCITRPVLATVVNIIVVLLGLVAAQSLSTREYPNIDVPTVTVTTNFSGASAAIIETQVTKVIEDQLSGIEGIDYITSISRAEQSQITVTFKLERDADAAASDVRDRVGRAREFLPEEVNEPIIAKVEADAEPIIYLAFSSDRHSELEVTDVADRLVQDRLQSLPGVASAPIYGERRYAMRVWIDAQRLAAYQMTTQDVETALRAQNVEIPAGRIEGAMREFTVLSETDVNSVEQFQRIVLKDADGYFVRLGDVARVEVGPASERLVARFNGESAVALGVIKQSTANPLDVSLAVQESLPGIRALLPEGMKVDIAYDSTVFITASIDSVEATIIEAIVLVVLVIFFFLRSVRAVFVPLVTIPISLIGACALMVIFGFSINVLTLLAFVVAIGLVVDDAIVVLENIYRHIEEGLSPMAAALKGSREIGFAVVAMTITLASVFVPVAFTSGKTGKLFIEFALTLSAAVLISGFVALTLSPMMCSRLLKGHKHHGFVWRLSERFFQGLNRAYSASLHFVFSIRPLVIVVAVVIAAANYFLFTGLRSELSPQEDRGYFIVFAIGPEGATVDYMDKYVYGIEGIAASVEDAKQYFSIIGFPVISNALAFVVMKDWEERERPTSAAAESVGGPLFGGLPGILAFPINPQSLGQGGFSQPIEVVVQTSGSYEELDALVGQLYARAGELKSVVNLDVDLRLNKPELRISVNRDKLAAVGVDVDTIGRTLETMLGGRDVTRFKRDGEQYDVIVQLEPDNRRTPTDLSQLYVRSDKGEMIQLSNLVTLTETVAPRELNHFNKLRAVTITGGVAPGATQGQGLGELTNLVRSIGGPAVQIEYGGTAREFFESGASLYVAFVLALLFVYLVMAAQFESFVDPFIIMLSVPLAMVGALLALTLSGGTLNIYSQVGLISLVGLIAKNGILVVEFANQLQEEGRSVRDAVLEASVLRLRPVLMTAGAMVLGALPLALATGAGAESREQIGWVLVGGVSLGTLFTLYIVPVVYSLIARKRNLVKITDLEEEIALGNDAPSSATAP